MIDLRLFDAVIFDMDGVLIDSEPVWKIAMEEVFHSVGCYITKTDFQKTVGLRLDEVIAYWFDHSPWENATVEEVELAIVQKMKTLISLNGKPLEGVIPTLQYLKNYGIKIGLATSSYEILIETVLATLGIKNFFDCTHSAENESYGKPHPAVYLSAAESLGVQPTRCLVIEDSFNGILAAKASRMQVVCIPEKSHFPHPKLSIADYQYETMQEFLTDISNN